MANTYDKENTYDEEDIYDEEEWLEMCRKARCYNGPLGGPPGLRRDEPFDIKKAQRFRQICEEMWNIKNPASPINGWGVFDPEIHKLAEEQINREEEEQVNQESKIPTEPFIRGQIASIESIAIMETEFHDKYEDDEDEYDKFDRLVDKYEDELYDDYEQDH